MNSDDSTHDSDRARSSGPQETVVREKVRIRFRKEGPLRFVSHNDLMRCWARTLRRTGLPIRFSEGFNPKPRLSSPLALALGHVGLEEIVEFQLAEKLDLSEIRQRLEDVAIEGLTIVDASVHRAKERTEVVAIDYECPLPGGTPIDELRGCARQALASDSLVVRRSSPNKPSRDVDIRPMLESVTVTDDRVLIRAKLVRGATLRVEEALRVLGIDRLLAEGVVVSRSRVELAEQ